MLDQKIGAVLAGGRRAKEHLQKRGEHRAQREADWAETEAQGRRACEAAEEACEVGERVFAGVTVEAELTIVRVAR